jgi:hypothetical protein
MKIGIIEFNSELGKTLQQDLSAKMEMAEFKMQRALDILDVLAYTRMMISLDQIAIIAQFDEDDPAIKNIFLSALATLEAETGKNIFKCFYNEHEDGESSVKELAETMFNYMFHPEKLSEKKKKKEEEEFI